MDVISQDIARPVESHSRSDVVVEIVVRGAISPDLRIDHVDSGAIGCEAQRRPEPHVGGRLCPDQLLGMLDEGDQLSHVGGESGRQTVTLFL